MLKDAHYKPHHFADDPKEFWQKDGAVTIDADSPLDDFWALTPRCVPLANTGYRMYYTGTSVKKRQQGILGYILSATSKDGFQWRKEAGIRLDVDLSENENWVFSPDVVQLADGSWRMYFQSSAKGRPDVILSAHSQDGLNWSREPGIRLASPNHKYGTPCCVPLASGDFRLYFYQNPLPLQLGLAAQNHILSALSNDGGTSFKIEDGTRIPQTQEFEASCTYAPEVIALPNGTYRMYYAAWSLNPVHGRILTATSDDGLNWKKSPHTCIDKGGTWDTVKASEPCMLELADGTCRLFYEACDEKGRWRILGATASPQIQGP